ncbi:MAG: class I SAM-dependent methyltransferase [Gemmatimonadales bacterium]
MSAGMNRVVSKFEKRYDDYFGPGGGPAFAVRGPDGTSHTFGRGEPQFTLAAADKRAMSALTTLDRLVIAESYLAGSLEIEGNLEPILSHRNFFPDSHPMVTAWHMFWPKIHGQERTDAQHISHHYDIDPDFFLAFLDKRHRCYSHGVFQRDDESLEEGITRKLDFAFDSIDAKPGDRVLDVGGGWGAFTEHAGKRDVRVTSLTISRESEKFLNELISREKLPCEVKYQHLNEHHPDKLYDAIVVLGVTEHLPDYDRTLQLYRSILKPGGKVYLDASAKRKKYEVSSFLRRHIYPGNGSPMCLHDYLRAVAESPFHLDGVYDDSRSYMLTARHWAERFEAAREEIERRWGRAQYRKFRLYLWGVHDLFKRDDMQAYRVVLRSPLAAAG